MSINEKVSIDYHTMEDIMDIRNEASQYHHHVGRCLDTAREMMTAINENTSRISAKDFCINYLDHLISENDDESNYYRRVVSNIIGGHNRPFVIYDEEDNKPLFYVPGLSPTFNTTNGLDNVGSYSEMITEYIHTHHNLLPLVRDRRHKYFGDVLDHKVGAEDSKTRYYRGWYEIMDFFGRIPEDEERYYKHIRKERVAASKYYYWIHPDLSLDEFITDKGRRLYGFTKYIQPTTPAQKMIELNNETAIDTEDWE